MTKIVLYEFTRFTPKAIHEFLKIQKDKRFELFINKTTIAGKGDDDFIYWEYHLAVYVGQKLAMISKDFMYYVPCERKEAFFRFQIFTRKIEELSRIICLAKDLFYCTDIRKVKYQDTAERFFVAVCQGRKNAVCQGLLNVAWRHLE